MIEVTATGANITFTTDTKTIHVPVGSVRFVRNGDRFSFYEIAANGVVYIFKDVFYTEITVPVAANANALETALLPLLFSGTTTAPTPVSLTAEEILERANWDTVAGNEIDITFYTTVVAANPSGSKNIQSLIFSNAEGTVFTKTFTYDIDNDTINITTS